MTGAGIGAGFLAGAAFGWLPPTAAGVLLIAWLLAAGRFVPLIPLVLIAGAIALGDWRGVALPNLPDPKGLEGETSLVGTIREYPRIGGSRQMFFVDLDPGAATSAAGCDERVRIFVSAPLLPESGYGDRVWVAGEFSSAHTLDAGFDRYLKSECAAGSFSAFTLRIEDRSGGWNQRLFAATSWLDRMLTRVVPGDRGALLSGLVTGRDDALSAERKDAFRNTGTSHITAISGSNLALLVTIATLSGRFLGLRRRRSWQIGLIVALWSYALLTGLNLPVGRAALVATGTVFAGMLGRRSDTLTLLALSGAAMVAVEPVLLWSLSFQLSMAASTALAVALDDEALDSSLGLFTALIATNMAAQVATLPFAVGAFGQIPLLALPANLIVAPLAQIAFVLAACAGLVGAAAEAIPGLTTIADLLAACAAVPAGMILSIVDTLSGIDGATVTVRAGTFGVGALAVVCTLVLAALSPDAQRWLARTVRDTAGHRFRVLAFMGTGVVATAVLLAITTFG